MNRYFYNRSDFEDDEPKFIPQLIDGLVVVLFILFFAFLLGYMQQKDIEQEAETQKQAAANYSAMLAECLNGGTLLDKETNTAYFCGKPLEIRL